MNPEQNDQMDADDLFMLGCAYQAGDGVAEDEEKAARYWRMAAEQGHAEAQYWLGKAYSAGLGLEQDDREAVKWLRKAARQGNADA